MVTPLSPRLILACALLFGAVRVEAAAVRVPPGFVVHDYATDLADARGMALGERGTVFVGSRRAGHVHALQDRDGDGRAELRWRIASGLDMPNGLAFHDGALYVATLTRVLRYDAIETHLDAPPAPVTLALRLPDERHHGWRALGIGPDRRLYVSVGAPCNACARPGYAQIRRSALDGSQVEVFAEGVRNSVGLAWRPEDGTLWFTDNGRDWMGDDAPADEINHAPVAGLHFGYPWCHGGQLPDPALGAGKGCQHYAAPAARLPAHVAPIGLLFYQGTRFPQRYRGQLFVAEHGSWNRSRKIGYRIEVLTLDGNRVSGRETFAEGWLDGESVSGRPAYLLQLPDGSLLVSDDYAGRIQRIDFPGAAGGSGALQ